jgi:MarR family transcriptional regulator, 2-MHQ and catechol-resistance regulon repressor
MKMAKTQNTEERRALRLWVILVRCFGALEERDRKSITRFDITQTEFGIMEMLYHKGPLPLCDIAQRMLLTSGSITYAMDKLEKGGFVRRVPCPEDRRKIYAELTEAGQAKMDEIFPQHAEEICRMLSGLSAEEQEQAAALLKKLGLSAQGSKG